MNNERRIHWQFAEQKGDAIVGMFVGDNAQPLIVLSVDDARTFLDHVTRAVRELERIDAELQAQKN